MSKLTKVARKLIGKPNRSAEWIAGPVTYNEDGLATQHNADFLTDLRFSRAYAAGEATGSWTKEQRIRWRAYVACWAADKVKHLPGDYVDCGVYLGGLARTVIEYINTGSLHKTHWLLDTWNGLVDDLLTPEEKANHVDHARYPMYYNTFDRAKKNFAQFPFIRMIKGAVPGTLSQLTAEKICYLSIDMNCVQPSIAAADDLWDRLSSGAVIVLDDYGFKDYVPTKKGFDEFAARRGVSVLAMPTGQGLIFKP